MCFRTMSLCFFVVVVVTPCNHFISINFISLIVLIISYCYAREYMLCCGWRCAQQLQTVCENDDAAGRENPWDVVQTLDFDSVKKLLLPFSYFVLHFVANCGAQGFYYNWMTTFYFSFLFFFLLAHSLCVTVILFDSILNGVWVCMLWASVWCLWLTEWLCLYNNVYVVAYFFFPPSFYFLHFCCSQKEESFRQ